MSKARELGSQLRVTGFKKKAVFGQVGKYIANLIGKASPELQASLTKGVNFPKYNLASSQLGRTKDAIKTVGSNLGAATDPITAARLQQQLNNLITRKKGLQQAVSAAGKPYENIGAVGIGLPIGMAANTMIPDDDYYAMPYPVPVGQGGANGSR